MTREVMASAHWRIALVPSLAISLIASATVIVPLGLEDVATGSTLIARIRVLSEGREVSYWHDGGQRKCARVYPGLVVESLKGPRGGVEFAAPPDEDLIVGRDYLVFLVEIAAENRALVPREKMPEDTRAVMECWANAARFAASAGGIRTIIPFEPSTVEGEDLLLKRTGRTLLDQVPGKDGTVHWRDAKKAILDVLEQPSEGEDE